MMEAPYHYQFRIIVIGDTMVGKSSLLKTFSEGSFGDIEPTVGVDFFSKLIEIKPKRHKSASTSYNHPKTGDDTIIVKLQIWDTAGQERFKSIVTSYYRNSVGIVLVYDVTNRESYDHLINWFSEACRQVEPSPSPTLSPVTHHNNPSKYIYSSNHPLTSTPNAMQASKSSNASISCDNSIMSFNSLTSELPTIQSKDFNKLKMAYLVIGCKTDLENQRQVSYEDGQAFANMYGFKFIETSSKMYYNVDKAFQMLAEEIYSKISESCRLNRLHRTPSGSHLTFAEASSTTHINEGIRIGPLIENSIRGANRDRVRLLEAQPVSGFLGGCC